MRPKIFRPNATYTFSKREEKPWPEFELTFPIAFSALITVKLRDHHITYFGEWIQLRSGLEK